jgi:hypothetical protein
MLIVNESACVLCSALPLAAKPRFREALIKIPLREAICEQCLIAFARNIALMEADEDQTDLR